MIRWLAAPVQRERIGSSQRERRVIRLHAVAPDAAIGADHGCWMSVDWQEQTGARVGTGVIVALGGIPVVDQHAILIGKVLYPVAQQRVIQEAEVVGPTRRFLS